jgi:hypothetical protein
VVTTASALRERVPAVATCLPSDAHNSPDGTSKE